MPGHTTNRGYPFPLDSEHIDVAGDVQRLAEAIDTDLAEGTIGGSPARLYNGTSYPPRGDVSPTSTVFWINHIDGTLPGTGGTGAILNVDVVFVVDTGAP